MAKKKKPTKQDLQTLLIMGSVIEWCNIKLRVLKRVAWLSSSSVGLIALAGVSSAIAFHVAAKMYTVAQVAPIKPAYDLAKILASRPDSTLVGTHAALHAAAPKLGSKRQTFSLDACPSTDDAVMKRLQKRSIAVMVTIDNQPGKTQCTLEQIVKAYGRPNASTTLIGSLTHPKRLLLFYDNGPLLSGPTHPVSPPQAPATVVPITLSSLPAPSCAGRTILSFVAHEDDDLLFMNPDHLHTLHAGGCLRTVYLTAGDDGLTSKYWLGREKGSEAAYDSMAGHGTSLWLERYVQVNGHEFIKISSPRGNPNISLVFLHLPDGNLQGGGFARSRYGSLTKLSNGGVDSLGTVDGESSYSKADLLALLVQLMKFYHPDQIDTQTPTGVGQDHSDHLAAGQLTTAAYGQYGTGIPFRYYTGYPISQFAQNVDGQDLADKTAAFNAYAPHDLQVCAVIAGCPLRSFYTTWLAHQYTYDPSNPTSPPTSTTPPLPATPVNPPVADPATPTN